MIYPGDLRGLTTAISDAQIASKHYAGEHRVSIHEAGCGLTEIRVFEAGDCVWTQQDEETYS
jgi:hypothetical protein